jgi:hypothetical protein
MKLISKQQENGGKNYRMKEKAMELAQAKSFVFANRKITYILFCVLGF